MVFSTAPGFEPAAALIRSGRIAAMIAAAKRLPRIRSRVLLPAQPSPAVRATSGTSAKGTPRPAGSQPSRQASGMMSLARNRAGVKRAMNRHRRAAAARVDRKALTREFPAVGWRSLENWWRQYHGGDV